MQLNQIATKTYKNPFSNKNYYIIEVDGKSLEDYILEITKLHKGLVPTLLNWLHDKSERKTDWNRVLPKIGTTANLPILMCSEDIDLWCDLIIVEVEVDNKFVYWNRFGIDDTNTNKPSQLGQNTLWFDNTPTFVFDKSQYKNILTAFRKYLDIAENVYKAKIDEIVEIG